MYAFVFYTTLYTGMLPLYLISLYLPLPGVLIAVNESGCKWEIDKLFEAPKLWLNLSFVPNGWSFCVSGLPRIEHFVGILTNKRVGLHWKPNLQKVQVDGYRHCKEGQVRLKLVKARVQLLRVTGRQLSVRTGRVRVKQDWHVTMRSTPSPDLLSR